MINKIKIKLFVYDFDGVMTNNTFLMDINGNEFVNVNRSDGLAISLIKKLNVDQIVLSTEKNNLAKVRAKKLLIKCFNNISDKSIFLKNYCSRYDYNLKDVAYVGNDINDYEAMKICGKTFCPIDADLKIKKISNKILNVEGGKGVIKAMYNYLF